VIMLLFQNHLISKYIHLIYSRLLMMTLKSRFMKLCQTICAVQRRKQNGWRNKSRVKTRSNIRMENSGVKTRSNNRVKKKYQDYVSLEQKHQDSQQHSGTREHQDSQRYSDGKQHQDSWQNPKSKQQQD